MDIQFILHDIALKSPCDRQYGCVILYRNKIIATGYNYYITNSICKQCSYIINKYTIHAEKDAIMKIKNKSILSKCKIYIGKIVNNKINHCMSCQMCSNLLQKYKCYKTYLF
jgi:deoxycytidylate deaminase